MDICSADIDPKLPISVELDNIRLTTDSAKQAINALQTHVIRYIRV